MENLAGDLGRVLPLSKDELSSIASQIVQEFGQDHTGMQRYLTDILGDSNLAIQATQRYFDSNITTNATVIAPVKSGNSVTHGKKSGPKVMRIVSDGHRTVSKKQQPPKKRPSSSSPPTLTKDASKSLPPEECDCMAKKHALLTNCLRCGKVRCEALGPGPCVFCQNYVQSAQQQLELLQKGLLYGHQVSSKKHTHVKKSHGGSGNGGGKKKYVPMTYKSRVAEHGPMITSTETSDKQSHTEPDTTQFPQLSQPTHSIVHNDDTQTNQGAPDDTSSQAAHELKNRLLSYDKSSEQRTQIHDSAEDFDTLKYDTWKSAEERAHISRAEQDYRKNVEEEKRRVRVDLTLGGEDVGRGGGVRIEHDPTRESEFRVFESRGVDIGSGSIQSRAKPFPHSNNNVEDEESESARGKVRYIPSEYAKTIKKQLGQSRARLGRRRVVQDELEDTEMLVTRLAGFGGLTLSRNDDVD